MKVVAVMSHTELPSLQAGLGQTWGGVVQFALYPTDVEAAQAIMESERPDVLVVDLDREGVVGMDTVRSLRQQPELDTMPILLVTSKPEELETTDSGRTVVVPKPVAPEAWKDALRRAISIPTSHETPKPRPAKEAAEDGGKAKIRKGDRKPFETGCTITVGGRKVKGSLKDISISGANIAVDAPLAVGGMISFSFAIPKSVPLRFLYFKARVVRQTPEGYGITFWEMDTLTRTFLGALVRG